jgi:hypothetical protein
MMHAYIHNIIDIFRWSLLFHDVFLPITVLAVPENDRCVTATNLTEGEEVMGDNSDANFDYNSQGICGSRSDRRAVWYQIFGVGVEVTVSVCTNNEVVIDYGIFFNCNDQLCLGNPPQQDAPSNCTDGDAVEHTFLAEDGENYYVHVRADTDTDGVGSMFTIKYTEPETDDDDKSDSGSSASTVSVAAAVGAGSLAALWM